MGTTNGNFQRWPLDEELVLTAQGAASIARSPGDLLYYDSSSHSAKPFSSLAALGSEALDQAAVAPNFLGVSNAQHLSTDANADDARIIDDQVWLFPCVSSTFEIGDFVGPTRNSGAALVDQVVAKVTNPFLAIGQVQERYASAVTNVKVRLRKRYLDDWIGVGFGFFGQGNVAAHAMADADTTLLVSDLFIQTQVPTAARNVTLPAEAQSKGKAFLIVNNSAGAFSITVKNAAAATIQTVAQNKCAIFFCDGTTWFGLLGA